MNPKLALTRLALLALVGSTLSGCIVYPRPYHERPYGPPPVGRSYWRSTSMLVTWPRPLS